MQYEADRTDPTREKWGEPSIAEMTEKAIKILQRSDNGYLLYVESMNDNNSWKNALTFPLFPLKVTSKIIFFRKGRGCKSYQMLKIMPPPLFIPTTN